MTEVIVSNFIERLDPAWNEDGVPDFEQTMAVINDNYQYTPSSFSNGLGQDLVRNEAGTNEGSCKIFAFAQLNHLNEKQTLACFGRFYFEDVLKHPANTDHANIRNFIKYGWSGISIEQSVLTKIP